MDRPAGSEDNDRFHSNRTLRVWHRSRDVTPRRHGRWLRLAVGVAAASLLGAGGLVGLGASRAAAASSTVYVTSGGTGTCASNSAADGLATIAGALACAGSGDIISVGPGTFHGGFTLGPGPVTLQGAGAGRTVIEDSTPVGGSYGYPEIDIAPQSTVTVEDLTVNGGTDNAGIDGTSGSLTVNRVEVLDTTSNGPAVPDSFGAIGLEPGGSGVADLTVTDSTVADNQNPNGGDAGITLYSSAAQPSQALLANDTVTNSGSSSIAPRAAVTLYGANATVVGDTIDANQGLLYGGLLAGYSQVTGATQVSVADSLIAGNSAQGVPPDCAQLEPGVIVNGGHNLVGTDVTGSTVDIIGSYGCGLGNGADGGISGTYASLSAGLGTGATTSLPVAALQEAIPGGATLSLGSQTVVTTAAVPAGATSIPVQSFIPQSGGQGSYVGYQLAPDLGPLADNGGPTPTQALLSGSPAIATGGATACTSAPLGDLDQRGDPRNATTRNLCDIGAYDTGGSTATTVYVTSGGTGTCSSNSAADGLATIAGALACAGSGDTISVGPGTFHGGFTLGPGAVTLRGAGAGRTVIEDSTFVGNSYGYPEIDIAPSSNATVKDLTVNGGTDNAGIDGTSGSLTVNRVEVLDTNSWSNVVPDSFGAIGLEPGGSGVADLTVTDSTVADNQEVDGGDAGITVYSTAAQPSQALLANDTVTNSGNTSAFPAGAVTLYGADANVVGDTIDANQGLLYGGLSAGYSPPTEPTQVSVANSLIAANAVQQNYLPPDCTQLEPGVIVNGGHNLVGTDVPDASSDPQGGFGCGLGNGVDGGMSGSYTSLSAGLGTGATTSLPVAALQEAIPGGTTLSLGNQTVVTTAAAPAGATSIPVESFTAQDEGQGSYVGYELAPDLGPLADNGGPTPTQALLSGSPAIATGGATACTSAPLGDLDQRGDPRNATTRNLCDIGAYDTGGSASGSPVVVATSSLAKGRVGVPYRARLHAAAGTAPYTWSIAPGSQLPAGLKLDPATGAITGTPQEAGTTDVTVVVADSTVPAPETASARLRVRILAPAWLAGPVGPPARTGAAQATDTSGLTVLFGGNNSRHRALSDTWELSSPGGSWQNLGSSTTGPSARTGASLVWDPTISEFVLFGGINRSRYQGGTWVFDPAKATWSELATNGSPPLRAGAAMAALPDGDIVLFGGMGRSGYRSDTWLFDPVTSTWSKQAGRGPSARSGAAVASGPAGLVLFGGHGPSGPLGDTWSYRATTRLWVRVTTAGTAPEPSYGSAMAFDSRTGSFVLFGGEGQTTFSAAAFSYDPASRTWASIPTKAGPSARAGAGLSFDPVARSFILFGGSNSTKYFADTWEMAG